MNWKNFGGLLALLIIFGCGGATEPYVPAGGGGGGGGGATGFFLTGSGTQTIGLPGGQVEYIVTVNLGQQTGKPGRAPAPVVLSTTGLPTQDVSVIFAANNVVPTTPGTPVDFHVTVGSTTPPGTYNFSVVGDDGTFTDTLSTYTLVINGFAERPKK